MIYKRDLLKRVSMLEDRLESITKQLNSDYTKQYTNPFIPPNKIPTLKGSIDAIIKYLGIGLVVSESKEPIVKAKQIKTKKGTK